METIKSVDDKRALFVSLGLALNVGDADADFETSAD